MREHLLGYLIGALEPQETQELERRLAEDEQLRQELNAVRRCLDFLAADDGHLDPPQGLAVRTCRYIAASAVMPATAAAGSNVRSWSITDFLVAASVLVAAALVFFPAASYSRYTAKSAACQNNLRQLGMGLQQYASFHGDWFPVLPVSGNEAAAGLYALILREGGYVDMDETFLCPGSSITAAGFRLPTRAELKLATGENLKALRKKMGGSYGYNLGYMDGDRYRGVRNRNRSTFALVADTPNLTVPGGQSDNHSGRGQNVLFEDGHVKFLCDSQSCPQTKDQLYLNDDGQVAPGRHIDDAVVGPSDVSPLGWDPNP